MTSAELADKILEGISKPLVTSEIEELRFFFFENYTTSMLDNNELYETSLFLKFMYFSSGPSSIQNFVEDIMENSQYGNKYVRRELMENVHKALPWIK